MTDFIGGRARQQVPDASVGRSRGQALRNSPAAKLGPSGSCSAPYRTAISGGAAPRATTNLGCIEQAMQATVGQTHGLVSTNHRNPIHQEMWVMQNLAWELHSLAVLGRNYGDVACLPWASRLWSQSM
eukprot:CAMPEP_0114557528 /NCGR_PEP_ID=MMETSP0114-20121206/9878_1 /TAXON_ID=31324 /ORGANISM="Goniomonas sp, Strain m" /LENGTH=127 /DNA_ID=CAMNT_0001742821 /DNA_START=357 /DNA_END=737 /DNA_ORIENTATION=-